MLKMQFLIHAKLPIFKHLRTFMHTKISTFTVLVFMFNLLLYKAQSTTAQGNGENDRKTYLSRKTQMISKFCQKTGNFGCSTRKLSDSRNHVSVDNILHLKHSQITNPRRENKRSDRKNKAWYLKIDLS